MHVRCKIKGDYRCRAGSSFVCNASFFSPYQRLIWNQDSIYASDSFAMGMADMTTLQAIFFGAMLAWTPAVIVMALVLYETPLDELDELQRDPS
jgi:hypothetical protein